LLRGPLAPPSRLLELAASDAAMQALVQHTLEGTTLDACIARLIPRARGAVIVAAAGMVARGWEREVLHGPALNEEDGLRLAARVRCT